MKHSLITLSLTITSLCLTANAQEVSPLPVTKGLLLDLNANKDVETEDGNRVKSWKNQIQDNKIDIFVKQDEGRDKKPKKNRPKMGIGSGRPTLKKDVAAIGGNNTLIFEEQELINHNEDAFDHLTQGSGYTWLSIICTYKQVKGKPDVNSFFGNLTNGKPYAGFWGNFMDDNRFWLGTRTGKDFGIKRKKGASPLWHQELNPQLITPKPLEEKKYYLLMGRMGAGTEKVDLELFVNSTTPVDKKQLPIDPKANPSKMAVGQERDATNHPGWESFHGEISRLLIFERPLTNEELTSTANSLKAAYNIK